MAIKASSFVEWGFPDLSGGQESPQLLKGLYKHALCVKGLHSLAKTPWLLPPYLVICSIHCVTDSVQT